MTYLDGIVVLVALELVVLVGLGLLGGRDRRVRTGALGTGALGTGALGSVGLMVALATGAVVVLLIGATVLVGGVQGPDDHTDAPRDGARSPVQPGATVPAAPVAASPLNLSVVVVRAADPDRFTDQALDGLEPGNVVRVRAIGFDSFERGVVEQCVVALGRRTGCGTPFPIQFDEDGTADFQYRLDDAFTSGRCLALRPTCLLRVRGSDSGRKGSVSTVFGDPAPLAEVQVEPRTGLSDAQAIEVSVTGLPAGTEVVALLCAPPGSYDVRRCGGPSLGSTFTVGRRGVGKGRLVVRTGPLGADLVACGARRTCGVVAVTSEGFLVAPATPIEFSRGRGAAYDTGRLTAGLLAAFVLLGIAAMLVRTTDWTKPTEAATPGLDNADLQTAADLDELFGTDEELEARDPLPF